MDTSQPRVTEFARGGGCACQIPPGELEEAVKGLTGQSGPDVLVGLDVGADANCPAAGEHPIDDPEPKYGMAVTGIAHPEELMCNDAAKVDLPLILTQPIGVGILSNRHKQTGEYFDEAVATMTELNAEAARAALAAGCAQPPMSPGSDCSAPYSRCAVLQASEQSPVDGHRNRDLRSMFRQGRGDAVLSSTDQSNRSRLRPQRLG